MEKMTKREMFEAIGKAAETGVWDVDTSEVMAFAEKEIAALDKKAAKAKERAAAKKAEGDALKDAVAAALTEELTIIADIASKIEGEDVSVAKVTYRLSSLVKDGVARKEEVTIESVEGKKRKVMAYALA